MPPFPSLCVSSSWCWVCNYSVRACVGQMQSLVNFSFLISSHCVYYCNCLQSLELCWYTVTSAYHCYFSFRLNNYCILSSWKIMYILKKEFVLLFFMAALQEVAMHGFKAGCRPGRSFWVARGPKVGSTSEAEHYCIYSGTFIHYIILYTFRTVCFTLCYWV